MTNIPTVLVAGLSNDNFTEDGLKLKDVHRNMIIVDTKYFLNNLDSIIDFAQKAEEVRKKA